MKKKKAKKIILCLIVIIVILLSVAFGCTYLKDNNENKPTNTVEVVDNIEKYGYQLEDRDTAVYKEKYGLLKETLEKEEIDYQEYATLLTQMFLIDLYTIENKINKYDVGSLDFIYETEKEKFANKVMDSLYKLVSDNSDHSRKQDLPVVKEVEIKDIKETKYKKGDTNLEAYQVLAKISYEKDLGYDEEVEVILVKEDYKLYVVNLSSKS